MPSVRRRGSHRVSETIVKRIKTQIAGGRLIPGERLPSERLMAERLSTSRVSVREAYRSLEELGLLTIRRGAEGGAFIAEVGHAPVLRSLSLVLRLGRTSHQELTEARLLIEPPIARLAARRASVEDIELLKDVVRRQHTALERRGDYRPFDLQFHRVVAQCARNLPLSVLMNSLADLTVEVVAGIDVSSGVQQKVCHFHHEIAEAIGDHDEDTAHRLMLEHVIDVQKRLGQTIARQRSTTRGVTEKGRRDGRQPRTALDDGAARRHTKQQKV